MHERAEDVGGDAGLAGPVVMGTLWILAGRGWLTRSLLVPSLLVVAAGILRVRPSGVLGELVTMRASGVSVVARFFRFFLGTLAGIYLRGS